MNRALKSGFLLFCVGAAASMVSGQGIESTPDTVVFSVETGLRWEDNRDATRSNEQDLVTLRLTPGVRMNLDDETTKFFLTYRPTGLWRDDAREDQNDTELYHLLEANVEHWASPLLKLGALNRFEMTDDPNVTSDGVTVRENASYWRNDSKLWTAYSLTERIQVDLDASYRMKRYEDDYYQDLGDENRFQANASLLYRLEPRFNVFGLVGYDRPTYPEGLRGEYNGYMAGVGLSRNLSDRLKGLGAVGYKMLIYDDAEEDNEALPFVQLSGEFKASVNLTLLGQADYALEPSDRVYYSSKEFLRFLLKGIYTLSDTFKADAQVAYSNGKYDKDSAIPESETLNLADGDDTLLDYQVGLTFRPPARRYYGRVAYEFEDWDSDVRESFKRNTVHLLAGVEF